MSEYVDPSDESNDEANLVKHARAELQRAGLFDEDADYAGEVGYLVLDLVKAFSAFGHSGGSAEMTLAIFNEVARFRPLGPITDDPEEWMDVDGEGTWQNRRRSSAFSQDGGKTYYLLDDPMNNAGILPVYKSEEHKRG